MQPYKNLIPLALVILLLISVSASYANTVQILSADWSFSILNDPSYPISQNALDTVGQVAYFGSVNTQPGSPDNFLYAVNITNGQELWFYNTSLPVSYVSQFQYNTTDEGIVVGLGNPSNLVITSGRVLAFSGPQSNATLWESMIFTSAVLSLGSASGNNPNTEDIVAGLMNGSIIRLSGTNGTFEWQYNGVGPVSAPLYDIFQLEPNKGSVIVGTRNYGVAEAGHIYCLEKNGTLRWSYNSTAGNPFSLARKFYDVKGDGVPDVVAVFSDDLIYVLDGDSSGTGKVIPPWPFNATVLINDLICTQDYTGDGIPDIVAAVNDSIMIINGANASVFKGPTRISSLTVSDIQYMYFYQNGMTYLNTTLAANCEDYSSQTGITYYIRGINATGSSLSIMKNYSNPSKPLNLYPIPTSSNSFTGDLLFTIGNTVYDVQGTGIVVPEFASNFLLVTLMISIWVLILIVKRRGLNARH